MRRFDDKSEIYFDLDRERLREITRHSLDYFSEFTGYELHKKADDIMTEFEDIIASNRVAEHVFLDMSSDWCPDMQLRVDLRRRKVLSISNKWPRRKNQINSFLRTL